MYVAIVYGCDFRLILFWFVGVIMQVCGSMEVRERHAEEEKIREKTLITSLGGFGFE
jgi:hypothetical protein